MSLAIAIASVVACFVALGTMWYVNRLWGQLDAARFEAKHYKELYQKLLFKPQHKGWGE